jgi:hypothetical protein
MSLSCSFPPTKLRNDQSTLSARRAAFWRQHAEHGTADPSRARHAYLVIPLIAAALRIATIAPERGANRCVAAVCDTPRSNSRKTSITRRADREDRLQRRQICGEAACPRLRIGVAFQLVTAITLRTKSDDGLSSSEASGGRRIWTTYGRSDLRDCQVSVDTDAA